MTEKTYRGMPVVWGVNEQGTREHAFVERAGFEWRSFKPRAICGSAWSNEFPPVPESDAPRCRACAGILQRTGVADEGLTGGAP